MHDSKYQCHTAACCTYHRPTYFSQLLNRSHTKKAYLLTKKNIEEFSGTSSEKWTRRQKKDKTGRVTGLGRRIREEIAKWNQMTALRFQTWGRHQTSPASLRGAPGKNWCIRQTFNEGAGLPVTHSLSVFDALEPIFTPFKSVLCMELTLIIR